MNSGAPGRRAAPDGAQFGCCRHVYMSLRTSRGRAELFGALVPAAPRPTPACVPADAHAASRRANSSGRVLLKNLGTPPATAAMATEATTAATATGPHPCVGLSSSKHVFGCLAVASAEYHGVSTGGGLLSVYLLGDAEHLVTTSSPRRTPRHLVESRRYTTAGPLCACAWSEENGKQVMAAGRDGTLALYVREVLALLPSAQCP